MTKNNPKNNKRYVKYLVIIMALLIATLFLNVFDRQNVATAGYRGYYGDLAAQCQHKNSYSCCLSSVRTMAHGNFKLSDNHKCPTGFTPQMIKCLDSLVWCEPLISTQ